MTKSSERHNNNLELSLPGLSSLFLGCNTSRAHLVSRSSMSPQSTVFFCSFAKFAEKKSLDLADGEQRTLSWDRGHYTDN